MKQDQKPIAFAPPDAAEVGLRMAHILDEIEAFEKHKAEVNKEIKAEIEERHALLVALGRSLRDAEQMTLDEARAE